MDLLEPMREVINNSRVHAQAMYVAALQHSITLIEIDPVKGLEALKDRLQSEQQQLEQIKKEVGDD